LPRRWNGWNIFAGGTHVGNDPKIGPEDKFELGSLCGDRNVPGERKADAATCGNAINGGHDRFCGLSDGFDQGIEASLHIRCGGFARGDALYGWPASRIEIGTCAKGTAGTGDHNCPHRAIGFCLVHCIHQTEGQRFIQ
jgi:hypothetical protein